LRLAFYESEQIIIKVVKWIIPTGFSIHIPIPLEIDPRDVDDPSPYIP
jgi:hypothetical protein